MDQAIAANNPVVRIGAGLAIAQVPTFGATALPGQPLLRAKTEREDVFTLDFLARLAP